MIDFDHDDDPQATMLAEQAASPTSCPEAEESVCASVMLEPDVLPLCELVPSDFTVMRCRAIWQAIADLVEEARPVDAVTIKDRLTSDGTLVLFEGGLGEITDMMQAVPSSAHAEEYARLVREAATRRAVAEAARMLLGASEDREVRDITAKAEEVMAGVLGRSSSSRKTRVDLGAVIIELMERSEATKKDPDQGLVRRTGTAGIDRTIGGLMVGSFSVLAARPGCGKTTFGLHLVRRGALAHSQATAFVSLEMTREQLGLIVLCAEARIESSRVLNGGLSTIDYERIMAAASRLTEDSVRMILEDAHDLTWTRLKALIMRLVKRDGVELVVVDYLTIIRQDNARQKQFEWLSDTTRSLKQLAKELRIRIVVLAQLNREIDKAGKPRRPKLSDLRGSGSIEQDADNVFFLHSEDSDADEDHPRPVEVEFITAKARSGRCGTFRYWWDKSKHLFPEHDGGA